MKKKQYIYRLHEVADYIHWTYFFHAWGFSPKFASISEVHDCESCRCSWLASFPEDERCQAIEALRLYKDALQMIASLDSDYSTQGICRLCEAFAEGDDLLLDGVRFPLLRQQMKDEQNPHYLCLSDFVRPLESGVADCVGLFVAAVDPSIEQLYVDDPFRRMLVQTVADRLAEATAEKMHEQVRRSFWGYVPDERLTMRQLHAEEFQGIRPAVGYPSLPDHSVNFILDELLDFSTIGVTLTPHGAMKPHASVSGLMLAHPQAHYFSIRHISREQLADYARRRSLPETHLEKFLRPLLD